MGYHKRPQIFSEEKGIQWVESVLPYDSEFHDAQDLGVSLTWNAYNLRELP